MHKFINKLTSEHGLTEEEARELTGGLLWAIEESAEPEVFRQVAEELPEAREFMQEGDQYSVIVTDGTIRGGEPAEEGALGADAGDSIHIGVLLKMAGIEPVAQSEVLRDFLDALRESVGPPLVDMVREQVKGLWDI